MAEETVILNLQVDQGKAEKDLIKIQKVILDNRDAQKELQKAYKANVITQEEYLRENNRLQQNIKKEQQQVNTLTKLINAESGSRGQLKARVSQLVAEYEDLNTTTAKGIQREKELQKELTALTGKLNSSSKSAGIFKDQIGNYPQALQQATQNIKIAGVSVGDLTSRLAAFANPATAAVGIVSGLAAAYARSTIGAKDLEFAQNQLSAAITLTTNAFAGLISSSEDGEGLFSTLTSAFLTQISPTIGAISRIIADYQEQLEDLGREELDIRAGVSDRLEENQELLTLIADDQADINEKLNATAAINANLINNQSELVAVKEEELRITERLLSFNVNDEGLQTKVLEIKREIAKLQADTEKKIQANLRVQAKLNQDLAEELRLRKLVSELEQRKQAGADAGLTQNTVEQNPFISAGDEFLNQVGTGDIQSGDIRSEILDPTKAIAEAQFRIYQQEGEKELQARRELNRLKLESDKDTVLAAGRIAGEASELFDQSTEAYKVLASASTLISTYSSAQKAYESLVGIPFAGPTLATAAAAVAIAQGLKRVAAINGIGFAEGGYTGSGQKYDVAGVVHKGEYVTPKHIVESPMAQGHINALERMRTGYADGGFVANTGTADANQALMMLNAIKMLPAPVVSWTEGRTIGNRVEWRENFSKLSS
jgi:chromosome segregation ATPase